MDRLDSPLLLLNGAADRRVPPEQSVRLAEAMRRAGKEVELVIDSDESRVLPHAGPERYARIVEWFRGHLVRAS